MMEAKTWVSGYFFSITLIFVFTYAFIAYAEKYYPLRFSDNVALDAKVRFLKDSQRLPTSDTVIMGSSMGLINLNGEALEQNSKLINRVTNISSWGEQVLQLEQILKLAEDNQQLKYVIFPLQMSDFSFDKKYDLDFDELKKYVENKFTLYPYNKVFLSIFNFLKAFYNYKSYHLVENVYPSLLYDETGGISYRIYGKNIDQVKWQDNRIFGLNMSNFAALTRIAQTLKAKNIEFLVITTPLRLPLLSNSPKWREQFEKFSSLMIKNANENGYHYLDLHQQLSLGDDFFADSSHMNYEGSVLISKKVSEYLDKTVL